MVKSLCIITRRKRSPYSVLLPGQSLAVTLKRGDSAHGSSMALHYQGERRARCTGAGYDMQSTVIADFLESHFGDRAQSILSKAAKRGAYGVDKDTKGVFSYNGGCGENSLCEAFGVSITNFGQV